MARRLTVCLAAAVAALAAADPPSASPPGRSRLAGTDYVKELLDDYVQGVERDCFFAAAGVDGELSKEEFLADAARGDSFVRPYDRWETAIRHDINRNGTLNWPEAEMHRLAIRNDLLARFDKDKDGKLTGDEHAAGLAHLGGRSHAQRRHGSHSSMARWDANRNGRLDEQEKQAMQDHYRRQAEENRRREETKHYDKNRDGKLDDAERAAMEADKAAKQRREQELLKRWDYDADGQLSRWERYVSYKVSDPRRQRRLLGKWDRNKNRRLDPDEVEAIEAYYLKQMAGQRRQSELRLWDKNKDGKLDAMERAALEAERRRRYGG